jgi:hypothetical protein
LKTFITSKRRLTIQYILLSTFLSLNAHAAPKTNALEEASSAIKAGDCDQASILFEKSNAMGAVAHYSLAICYSKTRDSYRTFSHAVDALCGTPSLEEIYTNGAKELVRWAGIELARPKHRNIWEDEPPDTDIASAAAKAEEAKKEAAIIETLKARVKTYVDVDLEIVRAKLTDICWDDSNWDPSSDCALTDSHRPPDVLLAP